MPEINPAVIELAKIAIGFVLIVFVIARVGGISFIFRLLMQPFKIIFNDKDLSELDKERRDIQLFRLLNGINVKDKKDAKIVLKAINDGDITSSDKLLTGFLGVVGDKKTSKADIFFFSAMTAIFLSASVFFVHLIPPYKPGHALLESSNYSFFASTNEIIDNKRNIKVSKEDCQKPLTGPENKIIKEFCEMVNSNNGTYKYKIERAINENEKAWRITFSLSVAMILLTSFMTVSGANYTRLNNKILELKEKSTEIN